MNMVKINLSKIYFWALALIAFFLPLIFGSHTNELYEFPKTYFLYFVGGALITIYVLEQIIKDATLPKVPVYIKLYILSYVVSSLFSMHHYTSFWGYYTRFNDCLMSTLVMFGLYVVAKSKLTKDDFENLFKVTLFSLIPVSILGISQHSEMTRVLSTFGQPNWLAQFLTLTLPLANYLFFAGPISWLWFVISILGFTCLWYTYSMSGILGYGIGFLVLLYIFKKDWFPNRKNLYKLIVLVVAYELIAATNLGVFKLRLQDTSSDIRNMVSATTKTYAADATSIAVQHNLSDPGFIRGGLWSGTVQLITSNFKIFLIGTGPETFPYAFQKFRPRALNYSSEWNFVFNKPHNYFLEVASEQGLLGLGIYLYVCWQMLKKVEKKYLPCLIGFTITNIFGWPTATTIFIFWMYLAFIEVPMLAERKNEKIHKK